MTPRQQSILASIVETYAQSAEPVGSAALCAMYDCSSATIRAEMATLEQLELIMQPHISAGRVPTDRGYRAYVNALSSDESPAERHEQVLERRLQKLEPDYDRAIKVATATLADMTGNMGLATLSDNVYFYGYGNLFRQPEFYATPMSFEVARFLDSVENWLYEASPTEPLSVYIGRENPVGGGSGLSMIIARFVSPFSDKSYIGLVGSTRQNYERTMSLVGRAGQVLAETFE
jgi:heat-inducible transcriptional repressor